MPEPLDPHTLHSLFVDAEQELTPPIPQVTALQAAAAARARARRVRLARVAALTAAVAAVIAVAIAVDVTRTSGQRSPLPVSSHLATPTPTPSPTPSRDEQPSPTPVTSSASPSTAPPPSTSQPEALPLRATPSPGGNPLHDEVWGSDAVPFAPPRPADYTGVKLSRRDFGNGQSILVPAGWAFADETIPSDHDDLLFYDPVNPAARIELTTTHCSGCIVTDINASQRHASAVVGLPADTARYAVSDGGMAARFRETPADGYEVDGIVRVFGTVTQPDGYAICRVALPLANAALAGSVLDSFQ